MSKLCLAVRVNPAHRRFLTSVTPLLAVAFLLLSAGAAHAITNPLISAREVGSDDISAFTKWTELMPRYDMQRDEFRNGCIGEECLNRQWEKLLKQLEGKPVREQIDGVNGFFNAIAYVPDIQNYGTGDYWQTPYELMEFGGDCEDYAIAKYISLKRLGVAEADMRILVVKDANLGDFIHAVLEVKTDGGTQILDNQEKAVLPINQVMHYSPIFAINETSWWAYK